MLQSMRWQRVGYDLATKQQQCSNKCLVGIARALHFLKVFFSLLNSPIIEIMFLCPCQLALWPLENGMELDVLLVGEQWWHPVLLES